MKTAEPKTASSPHLHQAGQPFFQKNGEGAFFSDRQTHVQTKPFFSKQAATPFIQPKLTIGQPGDKYEQEADAMADQVVQRLGNPETDLQTKPATSLANGITPLVQPKCAACEEDQIQKKEDDEDRLEHGIQRKPMFESDEPPPEEGIQRKCGECEAEEKLQKIGDGSTVSTSIESSLASSKGSGSPMPDGIRGQMESSFGADFSNVHIHTGGAAVQMNQELNAQAFTLGSDIYFNSGKYNTESTEGKQLLAHELTHVVQQNGDKLEQKKLDRSSSTNPGSSAYFTKTTLQKSGAVIQRFYTFAPEPDGRRPKGSTIHSLVLPMFISENPDLFIEVKIPGAKKFDVDAGKAGIVDFYRARPQKTIGIIYKDDQFKYLDNRRKGAPLQWGGGDYEHIEEAAPVGPRGKSKGCDDNNEAQICRLDTAPEEISLGDLKPGGSSEAILGEGQIKDYESGLTETSSKVNDFIQNNPKKVHPTHRKWVPLSKNSKITGLTIPPKLEYPTGGGLILKGLKSSKLSVYEGNRKVVQDSGLRGGLYVYEDKPKGVWSYEWFPFDVPQFPITSTENVDKALVRLNEEVIPQLRRKHDPSSPSSNAPGSRTGISKIHTKSTTIQRQPKSGSRFDLKNWETKHYSPWKKDTKALLADKKKLGNAPVAAALVELNQRSPHKLPIPEGVKKTGKGLSKLDHWVEWGGMFGKLRGTFGSLFLRIAELYENFKKRFDKGPEKSTKSFSFGSGPVGSAAKVAFGLMRQFLKIIAGRVVQNLKTKLKTGSEALAKHIFSESGIEKFTQNFKLIETEIQKINDIANGLHKQFDAKVDKFLKKLEDERTFLDEIKKGLERVGDIFSIVKWGIRLFHCASPPLFGCVKLAFEKLTTALIENVVKSCWFQEKAIRPLFNTIKFFKELPQNISDEIIKLLREIIPLPAPELEILLPSKIDVPADEIGKGELSCNRDKPTAEQKALIELYDKYGDEMMDRMLKLLEAKGIEEGAKLTVNDIKKIGKVMSKLSMDDLKKAEKNPELFKGSNVGKDLEELVKDIKSETIQKEFGEATGQIIETAEKTDKIAAYVQEAEQMGLFPGDGWSIRWDKDKVKNNKVSAVYMTVLDGENVAAFIKVEFIVLDYEENWVSGRIVSSTYFVNAEGVLKAPVDRRFFEGSIIGGGTVKD